MHTTGCQVCVATHLLLVRLGDASQRVWCVTAFSPPCDHYKKKHPPALQHSHLRCFSTKERVLNSQHPASVTRTRRLWMRRTLNDAQNHEKETKVLMGFKLCCFAGHESKALRGNIHLHMHLENLDNFSKEKGLNPDQLSQLVTIIERNKLSEFTFSFWLWRNGTREQKGRAPNGHRGVEFPGKKAQVQTKDLPQLSM